MTMQIGYLTEPLLFIAAGAAIALPFLLLNVKVAPRLGLIDWPKARGASEEQIPIVGHSMVLLTVSAIFILMNFYPISPYFLTTAIIIGVMGHFDDRRPLPPLDKFFFQLLCTAVVVYFDPQIYQAMVVKYGGWGSFLAVFFILGLVNAVNFIDGIDGLAGIVLFMGAAGFLLLSGNMPEQHGLAIVAALMMGMMVPFLYLNVVKRRGFIGNVGSYFFSYLLAMMHLGIPLESLSPLPRLSLSGLCFLIPIADAGMVVLVRLFTGRSPFYPDKGHLHHRLVQTGIHLRYILLNFVLLEAAAVSVAYLMAKNPAIRDSWLPVFVCVSHLLITSILILLVEKASRKRLRTYFERMDHGQPIYFLKYHLARMDGTPVTERSLKRLEARIGAEIRISDICFAEAPDVLFLTLKAPSEPVKRIAHRVEAIFHSESIQIATCEEGEYVKVARKILHTEEPPRPASLRAVK